jgi:hypothetical protein
MPVPVEPKHKANWAITIEMNLYLDAAIKKIQICELEKLMLKAYCSPSIYKNANQHGSRESS